MLSLDMIKDLFSINYTIGQLNVLIMISIIGGILVITSTNPIISIFFLIIVFIFFFNFNFNGRADGHILPVLF